MLLFTPPCLIFINIFTSNDFIISHLFPTANTPSGISFVTTDPAPTTLYLPIFTPGITVVPAPIQEPSPICTFPQSVEWGEICA